MYPLIRIRLLLELYLSTYKLYILTHLIKWMLCLLLGTTAQLSAAQVITADPPFVIATEAVTITFDAAQGNAGLNDCNCAVYLHTGTITSRSTSDTDWLNVQGNWGTVQPELEMTPLGDNKYSFTMTPSEFYDIPAGDVLLRLAFVFRNADGSMAGRAADQSDIFLEVVNPNDGLQLILQRPTGTIIVQEGQEQIDIVAFSSLEAEWVILDNGMEVYRSAVTTGLDHSIDVLRDSATVHQVDLIATSSEGDRTASFEYVVLGATPVGDPDIDTPAGLTYLDNGKVRLKLVAPGKTDVQVLTAGNAFKIANNTQMTRSVSGDYFWIDMDTPVDNEWVLYQYLIDGIIVIADPMSTLVLDPFHDQFVTSDYYPDYPAGAVGVVSAEKYTGHIYDWQIDDYEAAANTDLIIYELLMRDFLGSHSYTDLRDTLPYLKRLGINAIQLMPVQEFEGNDSWGYNPSFHKALDKYYGDPIAFKEMIDAAHALDMAVIVDVVYNHAFSQSPLCRMWWDDAAFRPTSANPYLNVEATHPFNVGYDFNHESRYTREWVKEVVQYWTEEYHIDGYRFDLSKGFTQRNTPDDTGAWGAYDANRIAIWRDYADDIRAYDPDAILILEHFGDRDEEIELADYGFMLWGNINYAYSEAAMGFTATSGLGGALSSARGFADNNLVSYMESHDEERTMHRTLNSGNGSGSYSTRDFSTAIDRHKLINVFHYLLPGPKMLWQFGELGYEFSINRCPDGSISNDCRLARKPIRWDYYGDPQRRSLYDHIADLTAFRRQHDLGSVDNIKQLLSGSVKKVELRKGSLLVFMVGNFDVTEKTTNLEFSEQTIWTEIYDGSTVDNTSQGQQITLDPGEYRVYTNTGLRVSADDLTWSDERIAVYPNPTQGLVTVQADHNIVSIAVIDQLGREVLSARSQAEIDISDLEVGIYTILVRTEVGYHAMHIAKH